MLVRLETIVEMVNSDCLHGATIVIKVLLA